MESSQVLRGNHDRYREQELHEFRSSQKEDEAFLTYPEPSFAGLKSDTVWLWALWPLLSHGFLTVIIAAFMLLYVDKGNFNISDRRPTVPLHDGSMVPWSSFAPLQSDITTILSVSIAILRLVAAGWLGSLCWRCALILMEEVGIKPQQLRFLVSYSFTTVPLHTPNKKKTAISWLIWLILALTLPVQLSAPVLTGSITWVPGHYPPQQLSNSTITTALLGADTPVLSSNQSSIFPIFVQHLRRNIARTAANYAFVAWGREKQTTALRRFLPGLGLEVNNTLTNITLPYFSVQSIEWVKDPKSTLSIEQLDIWGVVCSRITATSNDSSCPISKTAISLIPDSPWSIQVLATSRASVISERRLIVKQIGIFDPSDPLGCMFDNKTRTGWRSGSVSYDQAIYVDQGHTCYAFAWVNYTAGVGTCYDCPVSSYGTIQNNTYLAVKQDFLTELALRLMPDVAGFMRDMEFNDMGPTWETVEEDVTRTLMRSYAASWMALTDIYGQDTPHNTTYSISAPSSRASVNMSRVYIWVGLHSLVTLSGVLFIYIQTQLGTSIIADTTLIAFYLDTSSVCERNEDHGVPTAVRRVEFEGGHLRLKTK